MQSALSNESILAALRDLVEPTSGRDVVTLGFVQNIAIRDGNVRLAYALPPQLASPASIDQLRITTEATLRDLPGVQTVNVEFVVQPQHHDRHGAGQHQNPDRQGAGQPPGPRSQPLPGVQHVIAVGAGKGGVGKSTIAALLAAGLSRRKQRVGLLDADVYGPSIPKITGTEDAQPLAADDGRIIPPERDGIRIMSMGYMVDPGQAIVWRGPMAQKYVKEFLERGQWGELDYLIVDLPPGTGDIPLTLAQSIPLTGAVVVCTPQDVALLDAVKALRMYQKLQVDILGIVENMSYYVCPHCGQRDEIFSHGGAEKAARDLEVPFLGGIPLNIAIRANGDAGKLTDNFTKSEPHVRAAIEELVTRLSAEVDRRDAQRAAPPILRIRDGESPR